MLQSIDYRLASKDDIDFLYSLHVATMKEYVDKTWGWDDTYQESVFRRNYVPANVQIIIFEGLDIGMLVVEERSDDIFLHAIEIHPDYQGQGIAAGIISKIISGGVQKMKPVHLQVLKVNPAKRLYECLGFSVIEETSTHYIMLRSVSK